MKKTLFIILLSLLSQLSLADTLKLKLKDGTEIEIKNGEAKTNKDGQMIPVPDGTHLLDDNKKITIKDGKVSG